ncbi:glycosyltransferase family 4 protein [Cognatishimia activa]|uniref:GDP-mannose-dependent alpha-(1-6)-phosphatidylinositol monomannoside mannosyltransferase n=1 Tax=Cognatishimia activa TaxID=1715691 RepID=A0A0P1IV58_9RHOB|nr:glycosyltransferase family 4 protein [Cognatishimia activa]CUI50383.1 GDP-mannose-dependent alpha-(1-6)-phosphatidylinositol monomannoside mannosyltransferase [Cognatishimia activa]CUK27359.1 GDP-mannose-dependent alpha-(1-6)-phosphatidylinositol monomannoside mannosyltransferase [Cognatishimia activa]
MSANPTPKRPRVLVIAEAANPEWVSVPLVGWSLAHALRDVANVHLVTQIRNQEAIERAGFVEGEDFTAIDTEYLAARAHKIAEKVRMGSNRGWTTVRLIENLIYPAFERKVWAQFKDQITSGGFDIVHRVTPLTPTVNSLLARKCKRAGVPFVMGPLNGGVPWPREFREAQVREREWLSFVRSVYQLNPARTRSLGNASAIIVGSRHTQSEIPKRFQDKVVYIPENAISRDRFAISTPPKAGDVMRGCFIGRLVPYKGADMAIKAAAPLMKEKRFALDVIGDGPELEPLKALAAELGVTEQVTFHGWVAHEDVQSVARQSQLFIFPSVREFGGGVVLEAMALGLVPVICDYAGPGELVGGDTGYKIEMGTREQVIERLQTQLSEICDAPEQLAEKSAAALDKVEQFFTWPAKANQVRDVYDWVLTNAAKPNPLKHHVSTLTGGDHTQIETHVPYTVSS